MRRSAAAAFALAVAGTSVSALAQSFLVTENFNTNTDLYWDHLNNKTNGQNYGWTNTDATGTAINPIGGTATAAGEMGGAFARRSSPANYYGFNLTSTDTGQGIFVNEAFEARGVVHLNAPDGGSGMYMGFFRGEQSYGTGGNAANFVGLTFDDGRDAWVNVYDAFGNRDRSDIGTGTDLVAGNSYAFSMAWTPAPAGSSEKGKLDVNFNGTLHTHNFGGDLLFEEFTHFGVFSVSAQGGINNLVFDDLTFSSYRPISTSPPPPPPPPEWIVNNHGDWHGGGNWNVGNAPNGIGATAVLGSIINQPRLIFANSDVKLGTLKFDNASTYLIAGLGNLTMEAEQPASALVDVRQGSHKINLPTFFASPTTINVEPGATLRMSDPVTINNGVAVTQTGTGSVLYESTVSLGPAASLQFGNSSHMASLSLGAAASAVVTPGVNKVLRADSLDIAAGRLDLKDNKLITSKSAGTASGGVYSGLQGDAQSSYNFGSWDGPGLTTSMPDAGPLVGTTTIGIASAEQILFLTPTQTGIWAGQTVTGSTTLAMYTYAGDLNFDGLVDGGDYGVIDNYFQFPGTDGYANGDFNYDGIIDGGDYGIIDNTFALQGAPIPTGASAIPGLEGVAPVPEPASLAVLGIAAAGLLGRRRARSPR